MPSSNELLSSELRAAITAKISEDIYVRGCKSLGIFLAGSRIDGLGNEKSDVDAYVIVQGSAPSLEFSSACHGLAIEITYLAVQDLALKLQKAASVHQKPGDAGFSMYDALISHRFFSRSTVAGEELFTEFETNASRAILAANLVDFYRVQARDAFSDAVGVYRRGDYYTSAYSMVKSCGYALDMYLALRGDTNPLAKWRYKRAATLLGCSHKHVERFKQLLIPSANQRFESPSDYILYTAGFFQELLEEHAKSEHCVSERDRVSLGKDPLSYLFNVDGDSYLIGVDRSFRVGREVAVEWLRLASATHSDCKVFSDYYLGRAPTPMHKFKWTNIPVIDSRV